jgi:NADH-quinone oxidoreductase subunit J
MMPFELASVLYIALVALTVISAVMTVMQNHPVRSVLFLVLTFFGAATLWMMLQAEFLSLILVLVYVGAVMTLFLFVVMMLNVDAEALQSHLLRSLPLGLVIVGGLCALFVTALNQAHLFKTVKQVAGIQAPIAPVGWADKPSRDLMIHHSPAIKPQASSNTEAIGEVLFTQYIYPFELAAVLLLVAMVSAITLVHRTTVRSKRQNIRHQIMTDAKDRLTLVSFPDAEEK